MDRFESLPEERAGTPQPSLLNMKVHDMAHWTKFAANGGIGKGTAVHDCVAQSHDDLMFLKVCLALVTSAGQVSNPCSTMHRTTKSLSLCNYKSSLTYIWSVSTFLDLFRMHLKRPRRVIAKVSSASSKVLSLGSPDHLHDTHPIPSSIPRPGVTNGGTQLTTASKRSDGELSTNFAKQKHLTLRVSS